MIIESVSADPKVSDGLSLPDALDSSEISHTHWQAHTGGVKVPQEKISIMYIHTSTGRGG